MIARSNKKYLWLATIILAIVFLMIIFKPNAAQESTQMTIRIAVPDLGSGQYPSSSNVVIDRIYLNKLFEKEFAQSNIKVEWLFFKGAGPAINEALVNKQIEFAYLGDLAAIIGKSQDIDTQLLVATGRRGSAYLATLPEHNINKLEQLKNKRIAVWQGTAHQLSFSQFIHSYGYTEKDFKLVNLDPAATNAALASKKIDAGWGLFPILALEQKGLIDIPFSTLDRQDGVGSIQSGLIGRSDFIEQHPEIVQKLINIVLQSAYWVSQDENRTEAINLVAKNAGFPFDLYEKSFDGLDFKVLYSPLIDPFYLRQLQSKIDSAYEAKLIKNKFNLSLWKNDEFVKKGLVMLHYENYWKIDK